MQTGKERLDLIQKTLDVSLNRNTKQGVQLQRDLAIFIDLTSHVHHPQYIAGVDLAYSGNISIAVIVILDIHLQELEKVVVEQKVNFPYVPGLLTYREFPAFWKAYQQIETVPDIFIFDGQGLAHPRLMGIAAHTGILINHPTIGCAKSPLYGEYKIPGIQKGNKQPITINDKLIGYLVRTKTNVKPVYVSSGYQISPDDASKIVLDNTSQFKLPLATHLADKYGKQFKRKK